MLRRSFLLTTAAAAAQSALSEPSLGAIAFTQKDGLWVRALPAGKPEQLLPSANVEAPRFSPSGNWIAFFRNGAISVIARAGGKAVDVAKGTRGVTASDAQWLPGRDELLVRDAAGLKSFSPPNRWSRATRLIPHATMPVLVSPAGDEIVYADSITRDRGASGEPMRAGRLCRQSLNQPDTPTILFSKYLAGAIPCFWTGTDQVLFWIDPDFSASLAADGLDLYRIPASGGTPHSMDLTSLIYQDMSALSPDRSQLVVSSGANRYTWQEKSIAIFNLNRNQIISLSDQSVAAVTPSWSPAGDRVAWSAAPAPPDRHQVGGGEAARGLLAKRRIWIAGVSSSETPKQLTDDEQYRDEKPMWSADGAQILFCRIDSAGNRTLWLFDTATGHPTQVAGPLSLNSSLSADKDAWFGYYGYIDWAAMFDWHRGA